MKGRDRSRTRNGSDTKRGDEKQTYTYVPLVSEFPHPVLRVPGIKHVRWWAEIGRWVQV